MANAALNPSPNENFSHDKFSIKLIYMPSISDSITNWSIFEDDEQIIKFLHLEDTFKGSIIDDEQHEALIQPSASEDKYEYRNIMPKNIIKLEKLFDL
jgi:hypothetical protein